MSIPADPAGFLHLLQAEPTLLPEAPAHEPGTGDIDHRIKDEVHACLRCSKRARVAYVLNTELGKRWLDLCPQCANWLIGGKE